MKLHECTLGEHLKIEAVKYAIRAIPSGIYINTNEGDGTIKQMNTSNLVMGTALAVGNSPYGMAVNPAGTLG